MPIINTANTEIAKLADGKSVRYVNINDRLAFPDGRLRDGMSPDGLHFTTQAYQEWANALKPVLAEVLGPPADVDHAPPPTGDPSAAPRQPNP
jgi:lysophospholipase L1-like esterase